jgi:hypothetical protein
MAYVIVPRGWISMGGDHAGTLWVARIGKCR